MDDVFIANPNPHFMREYAVSFGESATISVVANYYTLSKRGNIVEFWDHDPNSTGDRLVIALNGWTCIELESEWVGVK